MPRLKWKSNAARERERAALAAALVGPVCAAAIVLAVPAVLALGVPRLQARISRTMAGTAPRVVIDWPLAPAVKGAKPDTPTGTWISPDIRAGLQSLADSALRAEADPLSPVALSGLTDTLARTGWFDRLDGARREPGRVVRVTGHWRIPAAVVRHNGLDHLVARGGELLPPTSLPGQSGQRVILGAATAPPMADGQPACGRVWGDTAGGMSDVQAGVQLLGVLAGKPWRDQVAGVDVSAYRTQRRLVIVTTAGGRVVWGAAPSERPFGEANLDYKLWRLDEMNRRRGRIDAGFAFADVSGVIATVDESIAPGTP